MIAFLKNLFRRNTYKINELQAELADMQIQRDSWIRQYNATVDRLDNLSEQKNYDRSISGAIDRETYQAKVYRQVGNTIITSQDTPSSTAFKLGIQHALRVVEQEVVV